MSRRCLLALAVGAPAFALGHSKTKLLDVYCGSIQASFTGATPYIFSGPDPWAQLNDVPASMPDDVLAFVYATGPRVRWVFLRIVDSDDGWSEDVNYFFREDGTIVKRVRDVQAAAANVSLEVSTYYVEGRVIKEKAHHHALGQGKMDSSQFSDPDAPVFWTVDDLPFPEIPDLWQRLA